MADREAAEDVVQETFLRCLRNRHKFEAIQHVSTWLYTITANLAKTELRRRKRWHWVPVCNEEKEEEGSHYVPVDSRPLPDQYAETNRVHQAVLNAIEKLPPEFREAVLLRDLNGLTYEEIARITDCPLGTVKSRVNRGGCGCMLSCGRWHERWWGRRWPSFHESSAAILGQGPAGRWLL